MAGYPSVHPQRDPRPREVTMVSILLMIFGGLGILAGILLFGLISDDANGPGGAVYALVIVSILLAITQLISGIFVFQGRAWARKVAIGICVLNIVSSVITLTSGAVLQAIIGIVINIAIIVNLNKPAVTSWLR